MTKRYEHTQIGYLLLAILAAALIFIALLMAYTGVNPVAFAVLVILGVVLVIFSGLTATIRDDTLEVSFGPGVFRKKFLLTDIESCQVVKNPWYYGWGIRVTPHGLLYNVSGFRAVEIKLKTGRKFRIGSDVPRELEEAINTSLHHG